MKLFSNPLNPTELGGNVAGSLHIGDSWKVLEAREAEARVYPTQESHWLRGFGKNVQRKAPTARPGLSGLVLMLVGAGDLVLTVGQVVHVMEHRRSGRQVLWQREEAVKGVLPVRRIVDQVAAL